MKKGWILLETIISIGIMTTFILFSAQLLHSLNQAQLKLQSLFDSLTLAQNAIERASITPLSPPPSITSHLYSDTIIKLTYHISETYRLDFLVSVPH